MGRACGTNCQKTKKSEGKKPLGRSRRRWNNDIKMYLRDIGWDMLTILIWLRIDTSGGLL
jgi:hypothetical protein